MVTFTSTKMPIQGDGFKTVLRELLMGTNPFTGENMTVGNIKALFLFNNSNGTIIFGYGSSGALLTIIR